MLVINYQDHRDFKEILKPLIDEGQLVLEELPEVGGYTVQFWDNNAETLLRSHGIAQRKNWQYSQ